MRRTTSGSIGTENHSPYVKDGINDYVVDGATEAVNPEQRGTKAAAYYRLEIGPGETATVRLRFTNAAAETMGEAALGRDFDHIFAERQREADEFYATVIPDELSADGKNVMRQALAGMLWSKQFYHYEVETWLKGDPARPPPPPERLHGRNHEWDAPLQLRRDLDAGQVGVSLVCGVGPGLPLHPAGAGGLGVRQGAARAAAARVVHAPERPDPRRTSGRSAT